MSMATPSGFSRCHLLFLSAGFVLSSCAAASMLCMISSSCSIVQSSSSSLLFHMVLRVCSPSNVTNSTCPSLLACFARSYCSSRKQLWCAFVTAFACPSQYALCRCPTVSLLNAAPSLSPLKARANLLPLTRREHDTTMVADTDYPPLPLEKEGLRIQFIKKFGYNVLGFYKNSQNLHVLYLHVRCHGTCLSCACTPRYQTPA